MAKKIFTDESLATFVDETKSYVNNSVGELSVQVAYIDTEDNEDVADTEAVNIIVDSKLSTTSTNPVQNKVVKKYIDSKIFVGTQVEYDAVADDIAEGCIVIITDQSISEPEAGSGATSAVLGKGVLGQLILGKV